MRRSLAVALTVVLSVAVVTAPGVLAANTAVGSINTTDTDFNNATTADNFTVSGSGTSAELVFDERDQTTTYTSPGTTQSTVPTWADAVKIDAAGASGGDADNAAGGDGGTASGTLSVTGGETIEINVGGAGAQSDGGGGGTNGGGDAGSTDAVPSKDAAGGGGATDVRIGGTALNDRIIVAGGGGGAADEADGGIGGGSTGGTGDDSADDSGVTGGGGGSQSSGGAGGSGDDSEADGESGSLGAGGAGGDAFRGGGGGGGGYYGGGGGGGDNADSSAAAGGGGSNYLDPALTDTTASAGTNSGDGSATVTYVDRDTVATYVSDAHNVSEPTTGFADISIENAEASVTWQAYDGSSWVDVSSATYTTDGNKTQSLSGTYDAWRVEIVMNASGYSGDPAGTIEDEGVLFENTDPTVDNSSASPSGGADLSQSTQTLSIDVNDSQFADAQGDSVSVEFYAKAPGGSSFSSIGTDTLTSNGTAQATGTFSEGGTWEWYATATDDYGGSARSDADSNTAGDQNFTFKTPSEITIREETPPHDLVTGSDVEVKIFENVDDDPTIVNRSDTDNDGKVSLDGLPTDSELVIRADAPGYEPRTVVPEDLYEQSTVFLLNDSATPPPVEVRFRLTDQTGRFAGAGTQVVVQRAINESLYNTTGGFAFRRVVGSDVGAQSGYTTVLQEDERYRIVVRSEDGDVRQLGAYQPETAGTINLEINTVLDPDSDTDVTALDVSRANSTLTGNQSITVQYRDERNATERIYVAIHERNNESNVLLQNTSFTQGPYGTFSLTENIPQTRNDTDWVVDFTAKRPGNDTDDVVATVPLSDRENFLPGMPGWLVATGSLGLIWISAGLFSQLNGRIGGVVVAGEAAILWFFGLVPPGLGVGVVILAMVTAGLLFIRDANSPTV